MERSRILQKFTLLVLLSVCAILLFFPASAEAKNDKSSKEESHDLQARVYRGQYLYFENFPSSWLNAYRDEISLELNFDRKFPANRLNLVFGGYRLCHSSGSIEKWAKWSNGGRTLTIKIGKVNFGTLVPFLELIKKIHKHHGRIYLVARAPYAVKSASLVFKEKHRNRPPRVYLTHAEPSGRLVRQDSIRFEFYSPDEVDGFSCRLVGLKKKQGGGWKPCESPIVYEGLENRHYSFRVRALGSNGKKSKRARHDFEVFVPPPGIRITRVVPPENPTSSDRIQIQFVKVGPLAHYSRSICRLDDGRETYCNSPVEYRGLQSGEHRVSIRRVFWWSSISWLKWILNRTIFNGWFNDAPVVYRWTIGSSAPHLAWTSTPNALINVDSASFEFSSDSDDTVFECRLDGAAQSCQSPWNLENLGEGSHEVQVVGSVGGVNSSPITFRFSVDMTGPELAWLSLNPEESPTRNTSFQGVFSVSEPGSVSCLLDGVSIADCGSPLSLEGLSEGHHGLRISAVDEAGNSSNVLSHDWDVDLTAPDAGISLVSPSSLPTSETAAVFEFTASDDAELFCQLDGGEEFSCESPLSLNQLGEGDHTLSVYPVDSAGNIGAVNSVSWNVDLTAPQVQLVSTSPDQFPTENDGIEVVFSTSEEATVSCELDMGGQVPCVSPFVLNGLAEGRHNLILSARDAAGNLSSDVLFQWDIRKVARVVFGLITPSDSVVVENQIQLEFSGTDVSRFECQLDGAGFGVCESPVQISALEDGDHQFDLRGVNLFDEAGPAVSYQWSIDSTGPAVTIAATPSEPVTSSTSIDLNFTADEAATFVCQLDGGAEASCNSPLTLSSLGDGDHLFSVVAMDSLGNRGDPATHSWRVDTLGPTVVLNVSPSETVTASKSLSASFTSNEAGVFFCQLDGASEQSCASPFELSNLSEGNHTLSVVSEDVYGNRGAAVTHSWSVDTTGPVVTLNVSPSEALTNSKTLSANFTASEAASFFCQVDGGAEQPCASPLQLANLNDGNHSLSVVAEDVLGNRGEAVIHSWSVDSTGPVVVLNVSPLEAITNSKSLTATFTANESASFFCQVDGGAEQSCASPFELSNLADGAHSLAVVAADSLGNRGATVTHSWQVDTVGPAVSLSASPSEAVTSSSVMTLAFSASGATGFFCRLDGGAETACSSPWVLSNLSEGSHQATVVAEDSLGNRGAVASHSWSVDRSGPVVTLVSANPSQAVTSRTDMTLSFSSADAASYRCALDGGTEVGCVSPYLVGGLTNGAHTLTVIGTDAVGNDGAPLNYTWTVSLVPNPVTLNSVNPSQNITASTTITFSFVSSGAASFECQLDGAGFAPCSSPKAFNGLGEGTHTANFRALNSQGTVGPVTSYSWTVDTTGPTIQFDALIPAHTPTSVTSLRADFSTVESGVSFKCSVNGGAEVACASPYVFSASSDGDYALSVVGEDSLGNRGNVIQNTWRVDTAALAINSAAVHTVTRDSAVMEWTTSLPTNARVIYGVGSSLDESTALDATLSTNHTVTLSGLARFTFYSVQAISVDLDGREVRSAVMTFRTLR